MEIRASPVVFISHVSEEAALAGVLKGAIVRDFLGAVDVFVSSELGSIEVGTEWLPTIEKALSRCTCLIVLCSHESVRRPWVNFELGAAWMRSIPIVPVCHSGFTPADLPMPLSVKDGLEASSGRELARLYNVIAKQLKVTLPQEHLTSLAKHVVEFEASYTRSSRPESVQFEYHFDVVLPAPGRLAEARIPAEALVESDAKTFELFGLLAGKARTWRDLEKAAKHNRDTRWLAQLQKSVYLASNDESFMPVQAIFHTDLGSFQPEFARMDRLPNGSRKFHIHLVRTVVTPLAEVPNDFGTLATLLRLGLRFRYEVISKFEDALRIAKSTRDVQPNGLSLIAQVRTAIETIECDAFSRGAANVDTESVAALFEQPDEEAEIRRIQRQWEAIRSRLFDDATPVTLKELRQLFDALRDVNFRFMVLGTRQYQVRVKKSWGLKPGAGGPKASYRRRTRRTVADGAVPGVPETAGTA